MKDFFQKLGNQIREYFEKLEKGQKRRFFILAAVIVAVIVAVLVVLNPPTQYGILYSGLEPAEAGQIKAELTGRGIDVKTQGEHTLLVPEETVSDLRMDLAMAGYPKSTQFTTDIFQQGQGLAATELERETYLLFQQQEYLRQAIITMDKVRDCKVIITPQEKSIFVLSSNNQPAKAMVLLTLDPPTETLSDDEIRAIYHMVLTSVQGLTEENISIVDSRMKLYALSEEMGAAEDISLSQERLLLTRMVKEAYEDSIVKLLDPVFGAGNTTVQVDARLDFDNKAIQDVTYNPPVTDAGNKGIEVSYKELYENIKNPDAEEGEPGLDTNGGLPTYPEDGTEATGPYSRITREVNMEVNETRTQIESAKGQISELSVGVFINTPPLGEEEDPDEAAARNLQVIEQVKAVVSRALGIAYDPNLPQNQRIAVEMVDFQPADAGIEDILADQEDLYNRMRQAELIRLLIIAGTVFIVMLLIFLMIRSLRPKPAVQYAVSDVGGYIDVAADDEEAAEEPLSLDVTPQKTPAREQIEKLIDSNPDAVAQLLRNWLQDDYR